MSTFNESDASLQRIITEGLLIEAMIDIINSASRSPYDYKSRLADVEAIRAAANSQTAKRVMFCHKSRDRSDDDAEALAGLLSEWESASCVVGPGRRTVPFPLDGGFAKIHSEVTGRVLRKAKLPPPMAYPKAYEEQDDLIATGLLMAKYNLECTYQALVALYVVSSYFGGNGTGSKTVQAEVDKLRDALWSRARDYSGHELMFTLLLGDETETGIVKRKLLKDTLGNGMSIMHYLVPFNEIGSYRSIDEERFRNQLKAVK